MKRKRRKKKKAFWHLALPPLPDQINAGGEILWCRQALLHFPVSGSESAMSGIRGAGVLLPSPASRYDQLK